MKSPAFQWYPTDYLGSQRVQMLTLEEEGAYLRLLCSCWQHGSIPSDLAQLAKLIGKGATPALAASIAHMFTEAPQKGRLIHDRLETERSKQAEYRAAQSGNGRKGAEKRWHGGANGGAIATPMANDSSPSSVSCLLFSDSDLSASIYAEYPRKVARKSALKAIGLVLATTSSEHLLERTKAFATATASWPEADKQFIPHPATWFNRGSYEDDPETWKRYAKPNPHQRANDRSFSQVDDYSKYKPRPDQLEAGA